MQVGLCTIALRGMDVFKAVEIAAEYHVDAVEIWGRRPHMPLPPDEDYLDNLREHVAQQGLRISVYGSYVNPLAPEFDTAYPEALRMAARLNAPLVRIWAGSGHLEVTDDELWWQCADGLRRMAYAAEELGLQLVLEMHDGTLTDCTSHTLRLLDMTGHPALRVNWQPYTHPECDDSLEALRALAPHVANVHAQNFRNAESAGAPAYELTLIDDRHGLIDYQEVVAILRGVEYQGCLSIEFLKREFETESAMLSSLRRDVDYLRRIL